MYLRKPCSAARGLEDASSIYEWLLAGYQHRYHAPPEAHWCHRTHARSRDHGSPSAIKCCVSYYETKQRKHVPSPGARKFLMPYLSIYDIDLNLLWKFTLCY